MSFGGRSRDGTRGIPQDACPAGLVGVRLRGPLDAPPPHAPGRHPLGVLRFGAAFSPVVHRLRRLQRGREPGQHELGRLTQPRPLRRRRQPGLALRQRCGAPVRYPTALAVGAARVWARGRAGQGRRRDPAGRWAGMRDRAVRWGTGTGGRCISGTCTRARWVCSSAAVSRARCTSMSGAARTCPRTGRLRRPGPPPARRCPARGVHVRMARRRRVPAGLGHDRRPAAVRSGRRPRGPARRLEGRRIKALSACF